MDIGMLVFAILMVVWLVLVVRTAPVVSVLGMVSWSAVLVLSLKVFGVLK